MEPQADHSWAKEDEQSDLKVASHSAGAPSANIMLTSTHTSHAGEPSLPSLPTQLTNDSWTAEPAVSSPSTPALWRGWAELENDPTIFNVLLRDWGVTGVRVREVVPLDAIFDSSASSTYGLIFLSRYSPSEQHRDRGPVPSDVWFANQTSSFSCATVALMNIVNNNDQIHLGPELQHFKSSTLSLSSKDRGLALDAFNHVRRVHNSFASEIDMMTVDLRLKQDVSAAKQKTARSKKNPKNRKKKTHQPVTETNEEEEENGFHFIAYVPAHGSVWKMDGMEAQPERLEPLSSTNNNWLATIIPELSAQWELAEEKQLEYSLLSLVVDDNNNDGSDTYGHGHTHTHSHAEDQAKATRLREDWSPLIAALVRMHAAKGTLEKNLSG